MYGDFQWMMGTLTQKIQALEAENTNEVDVIELCIIGDDITNWSDFSESGKGQRIIIKNVHK